MHVLGVTRTLRLQGGIPIRFWGHVFLLLCIFINILPYSVIRMSPYERLYNHKPSLLHLRVLGCLCYANIVNQTNKLESRTRTIEFMGYLEVQKSNILFDLNTKSFFVNGNVVFKENEFPFILKIVDLPLFQQLHPVTQNLVNSYPFYIFMYINFDSINSNLEVAHTDEDTGNNC